MRSMRAIFIFVIAISVAMLPMRGAIAAPMIGPATATSVASAHDCCDHDGMPAGDMMKDCQAAAGCASKCFSLYGGTLSGPLMQLSRTGMEPLSAAKIFRAHEGSPPFRPPRA